MSKEPLCSKYLNINLEIQPGEDEYECLDCGDCICNFCGEAYKKFYVVYIHDSANNKKIKTKSCALCGAIVNFKGSYMGKCFLAISQLDQSEINSKILKNFNSEGTILTPTEIDPKSKIVDISIYEFINAYVLMSSKEKKLFGDLKVMFTSNIISSLQNKTINYFSTCDSDDVVVKKHDCTYFDSEKYKLNEKQQTIFNKYVSDFNSKQLNQTKEIKLSIEKKNLDAIKKCKVVSDILNLVK